MGAGCLQYRRLGNPALESICLAYLEVGGSLIAWERAHRDTILRYIRDVAKLWNKLFSSASPATMSTTSAANRSKICRQFSCGAIDAPMRIP